MEPDLLEGPAGDYVSPTLNANDFHERVTYAWGVVLGMIEHTTGCLNVPFTPNRRATTWGQVAAAAVLRLRARSAEAQARDRAMEQHWEKNSEDTCRLLFSNNERHYRTLRDAKINAQDAGRAIAALREGEPGALPGNALKADAKALGPLRG